MEERYWLRHPSLADHRGPYLPGDLRTAIETGALPIDSYVLRDRGQSEQDRIASPQWRKVSIVLGMEPAEGAEHPDAAAAAFGQPQSRHAIRHRLRQDTAYAGARTLITILACVALLILVAHGVAGHGPSGDRLINSVLGACGALAATAFMQAMLDIADCCLRSQR